MSIAEGENKFDGNCKSEEYLQWSPFKEYDELHALGISLDLNNVKSLIEGAFPDQKQQKETQCSKLSGPLQENVQDLTSFLYDNKPCDSQSKYTFSCTTASKCTGKGLMKGEVVCVWEALLHSFFQKKLIKVRDVRWRRTLYDVLSLDLVEKAEGSLATSKKCSVLDDFFYDHSKDPEFFSKPDPIYSRFGKLRNGFHVSSNGLVFPNESELKKFNVKMAEMDAKLNSELGVILHQHNKLKAKAEERKLLSQRTESHEESDLDDEPKENQQFNKESKPKDKPERKSGLFASLTASLNAARSGIQGFLEKSSPKATRHSAQQVPGDDNDDSEDETGKLTHSPNSQVTTVDGIDNHDEFTRQMQAKGGLVYESADRTVQQLSHDALPPPLSLQTLQAGSQENK